MLQPDYFCKFKSEEDIKKDINYESHPLIKEIEERYISGFYEEDNFSFDPKEEFLDENSNTTCIPAEMLKKSPGTVFERQDIEFAFLRNPNEKELKTINTKIADAVKIIQISNPDFVYDKMHDTINAIIESVEYWKTKELGKVKIKNVSFSAFYSRHKRDANIVSTDSLTGFTEEVSSFQETGYHRLPGELTDKNSVREIIYGGNINFRNNTIISSHFTTG